MDHNIVRAGRAGIVAVIAELVPLARLGRKLRGECPFHPTDLECLEVCTDENWFWCHSCGREGDVVTFVMECEGCTEEEAMSQIAETLRMATEKLNAPRELLRRAS